jgi:hypothetical protein
MQNSAILLHVPRSYAAIAEGDLMSSPPAGASSPEALFDVTALEIDIGPLEGQIGATPRETCRTLRIGMTRLYSLMSSGTLKSYKEGKSRRIFVPSIKSYVLKLLTDAADHPTLSPTLVTPRKTRAPPEPLPAPRRRTPKARTSTPAPA